MPNLVERLTYPNGTPFSDEEWKMWYGHTSNKEKWIAEQEEIDQEQHEYDLDVAKTDQSFRYN